MPTAGAIIDRFLHHAQVIAITGKSYRVKEAPVVTQENKKSKRTAKNLCNQNQTRYEISTSEWPVLNRPRLAGFELTGDNNVNPVKCADSAPPLNKNLCCQTA